MTSFAATFEVTSPSIIVARFKIASSVTTRFFVSALIARTTCAANSCVTFKRRTSIVPGTIMSRPIHGSDKPLSPATAFLVMASLLVCCSTAWMRDSASTSPSSAFCRVCRACTTTLPASDRRSSKFASVSPSQRRAEPVESRYRVASFWRAILIPCGVDAGVRALMSCARSVSTACAGVGRWSI